MTTWRSPLFGAARPKLIDSLAGRELQIPELRTIKIQTTRRSSLARLNEPFSLWIVEELKNERVAEQPKGAQHSMPILGRRHQWSIRCHRLAVTVLARWLTSRDSLLEFLVMRNAKAVTFSSR